MTEEKAVQGTDADSAVIRQFFPSDPEAAPLAREKTDRPSQRLRRSPGIKLCTEFLEKAQHLAEQSFLAGAAADVPSNLLKNLLDTTGIRQMNQREIFGKKLTADRRLNRSVTQKETEFPGHSGWPRFHRKAVPELGD